MTDHLPDTELEEIRAREKADVPWAERLAECEEWLGTYLGPGYLYVQDLLKEWRRQRTDIPRLLAEVEMLKAELAEHKATMKAARESAVATMQKAEATRRDYDLEYPTQ